jgi:hypothetical protein
MSEIHIDRGPAIGAGLLFVSLALSVLVLCCLRGTAAYAADRAGSHIRAAISAHAPRSRPRHVKCVAAVHRRGRVAKQMGRRPALHIRCAKKPRKRKHSALPVHTGSGGASEPGSGGSLPECLECVEGPLNPPELPGGLGPVQEPSSQEPSEGGASPGGGSEPPGSPAETSSFRFFAPSSFWNAPVPVDAQLDPSSGELVSALDATVRAEEQAKEGPWINTTYYSLPVYTVPAGQPTVKVTLNHAPAPSLEEALSAVPLPPDAHPATGTDGLLAVWQPSTDQLWEFWRLVRTAEGWQASWAGAMQKVSSNQGVYGPDAWPGAKTWWGASATSLALVGGLISLEDLREGVIDHALSMSLPSRRAGIYASPAQRTDGKSDDPLTIPEGAHLRLNPNLDLTTLHLPPLTLMIARAAQRYGIFIKGGAHNVIFEAQDPTPTGTNPYTGPHGYFEGKLPSQLLASFPWNKLQVLKMELHHVKSSQAKARRAARGARNLQSSKARHG